MSERYEVWDPHKINRWWRIRDRAEAEITAMFSCSLPDAEARARQLCAELNAAEAKKASEKP